VTKIDKKWQSSKSEKMTKIKKHEKWQKQKNVKTQNHQNAKSEKHEKWWKKWPPLKMAKMSLKWPKSTLCEIRAAWSGVFSIPGGTTGPGFKAGFRPPLKLMFFDTFYAFLNFMICAFWSFLCFIICVKLYILVKVTFLT